MLCCKTLKQLYAVVFCLKIVKLRKCQKRDTIWVACHDFCRPWACFSGV